MPSSGIRIELRPSGYVANCQPRTSAETADSQHMTGISCRHHSARKASLCARLQMPIRRVREETMSDDPKADLRGMLKELARTFERERDCTCLALQGPI